MSHNTNSYNFPYKSPYNYIDMNCHIHHMIYHSLKYNYPCKNHCNDWHNLLHNHLHKKNYIVEHRLYSKHLHKSILHNQLIHGELFVIINLFGLLIVILIKAKLFLLFV